MRNNISVSALSEFVNEVKEKPEEGVSSFGVELNWQSGTRFVVNTLPMEVGPHKVSRDFSWVIDEPRQLLGTNHAPNPSEYLLSALGACISVGFTVGASLMEIQLESLKVSVKGQIDLAGFLGAREGAPIAFEKIEYEIEVIGDGTPEQFEILREKAVSHSPNAMTIQNGVDIQGSLKIGES
ncbi:OsmC family protein [Aliikangiella sp. IMCC44359]|uniref:OsmC family protein n=1 Tax=Aliikangiella sp. IMCC44359 TaxID=3459125 RepID=UPI00403AE82F